MNQCEIQANLPTINSQKVYDQAKACLGISLVPVGDDRELGCAISVTVLLKEKVGMDIQEVLSTNELLGNLIKSPYFQEVANPLAGDIVISATGTSTLPNTPITHGHVGIVGLHGIMSNNSYTGLWSEFYTLETWKERYSVQGGYPIRYFRAL